MLTCILFLEVLILGAFIMELQKFALNKNGYTLLWIFIEAFLLAWGLELIIKCPY